jgi:hypothetical protein
MLGPGQVDLMGRAIVVVLGRVARQGGTQQQAVLEEAHSAGAQERVDGPVVRAAGGASTKRDAGTKHHQQQMVGQGAHLRGLEQRDGCGGVGQGQDRLAVGEALG